jgi:hypothetical protein
MLTCLQQTLCDIASIDNSHNQSEVSPLNQPTALRLLPELWLMLLEHLSFHDIENVSLTCRDMCFLVQPLLFRHVHICIAPPLPLEEGPRKKQQQRSRERIAYAAGLCKQLAFYRTPRIASAIRGFKYFGSSSEKLNKVMSEAVFDLLLLLPNLYMFTCEHTSLTATSLKAIQGIPALSSLVLSKCSLSTVDGISRLPLRRLDLNNNHGDNEWALLLHPEHLQHLRITSSHLPDQIHSMRGLRMLNVHTNPLCILDCIPFLEQCPCLEVLSFVSSLYFPRAQPKFTPSPSPDLLSSLVSFHGPAEHLQIFCRGKSLKHVSLWSYVEGPAQLPHRLRELSEIAPQLQSVTVRAAYLTQSILNNFLPFTARELTIYTRPGGPVVTREVCSVLAPCFVNAN